MYIRTGGGLTQAPSFYRLGDATASSVEADRRFKRVAALVTDGLKTAKDAVPHLATNGQRELALFMTSILDTFFPSGHGLIDAHGKVLRPSQKHTVAIPLVARDGANWQFEHRVRLFVSDQTGFRKSGEHLAGHFSSIRLFTQELHKTSATRAVLVAIHEMTHMMFAMFRRLENWLGTIGGDTAARVLSRQP